MPPADPPPEIPHTVERPPAPGTPAARPMDPDEPRVDDPTPLLFSEDLYRALQQGMQQKQVQKDFEQETRKDHRPVIALYGYDGVETFLVPDPVFVDMPPGDKLGRALHQVWDSGQLGEDFKDALEALLSPESLLFFAIFIGLQFVPGVDVAVDVAGFTMLLIYVGGLSVDLCDALTAVARAQNKQQFDRAAGQLSNVLGQIGAGALTALAGKIAGDTMKRIKSRRAKPGGPVAEAAREWTAPKEPVAEPPAATEVDPIAGTAKAPDPVSDPVGWQIHVTTRVVRILKAWTDIFPEIPADRVKAAENVKVEVTDQAGLNARWKQLKGADPKGNYPAVRFTDPTGRQLITTTTDGIHVNAHEVGHTLQNPTLRGWGGGIFEAFNEHFTQKLLEAYEGKVPCDYVTNGSTGVIERIIKVLGPDGDRLTRAVNFGDGPTPIEELGRALDSRTEPGFTQKLVNLVNTGQAPEANALLDGYLNRPPAPAPPAVTPPAVRPPASAPPVGVAPFAPSPAASAAAAELRPLFSDFKPVQAEWAVQQYEQYVFAPWLNVSHPTPTAADAWREQVVGGIRADLGAVPSTERWPVIVNHIYSARLYPYEDQALNLAVQTHRAGVIPGLHDEALGGLNGLHSYDRELNWFNPQLGGLLAPRVERSAMDFGYALDGGHSKSLHLGSRYFYPDDDFDEPYVDLGPEPLTTRRSFGWQRPASVVPALFLLGAAVFAYCDGMPSPRAMVGSTLTIGSLYLEGAFDSLPISTAPVQNPSSAAAGAHVSTDPTVTHVKLSLQPGVFGGKSSGSLLEVEAAQLPAELACGQHGSALTVCAKDQPLPPGPFWIGHQQVKGPVPLHDTHGWYQFGLVLNDGNPDHGVPAGQAPQNSYRGGVVVADLQYNATDPAQTPAWKLTTYLVQGPAKQSDSNFRVILDGDRLVWVLPQSEVPIPSPTVRFAAYHAPGTDFGLKPPYDWNASIDPPVNQFAPAGRHTLTLSGAPAQPGGGGGLPWWWLAAALALLGALAAVAGAWWVARGAAHARSPAPS